MPVVFIEAPPGIRVDARQPLAADVLYAAIDPRIRLQ